uniref:RecA n=1 Tax=viral metagenome TaxID=1070528 RepID=A0A6C0JYR2_9ZZZZ
MGLLDRVKVAGTVKSAEILSESTFFNEKDVIPTDLPILNVAFSGKLDGGLVPGLTVFAGASKTFKTLLGLFCIKAFLTKYPDSICLFYDSEFGVTPQYLKSNGIDASRVLHIPIENIEQLKFDVVKRLEAIERKDKVIIFVDSIGALSSKKEVEDAIDEKSVADMTRAKSIRSLFRIITPHLTTKDIPCIVINHVYQTMELYAKTILSGGTSIMYSSNQVFIITKSQEKDGTDIVGWNFTINIEKSRFVKEKSKFMFLVNYDKGIQRYSGLLELAIEGKFILNTKQGWYNKVDLTTGEIAENDKGIRLKTLMEDVDFWENLLISEKFKTFVSSKYQFTSESMIDYIAK